MLHILCHTLLFRLPNLLPHLPLPGDPYYLPAPWVPLSWAPSVVLAVSAAGRPDHASPWLAPVEGFQHFQVLVVLEAGRPDRPLPLKYPGNWFHAQPVCGPPACTLQKNVRNRCYNHKGDGHFGCVQQAHLCCYKWTCTRSIASPQHLDQLHGSPSHGPAKPVGWGGSRNRMDID